MSLPNTHINFGLALDRVSLLPPPPGAAPSITADDARDVAIADIGGEPAEFHSATLVEYVDWGQGAPPILAWIIDLTPTQPVPAFGGPPASTDSTARTVQYTWKAVVVDAEPGDARAGMPIKNRAGTNNP